MNKIIITGNLTKDPELKEFPSGSKVCEFVVAVNKNNNRKKEQDTEKKNPADEADFFHVQVWNKLAEVCNQYLVKGRRVTVEGPVTLHTYPLKDKEGNVMKDADGRVITRSHLLIKSPPTLEFDQKRYKVESNENSTSQKTDSSTQKTAAKPASAVNKANYTAMAASENDELPY